MGLKTADRQELKRQLENFRGEKGESIALFTVLDKNQHELLTGQDDKHLDFRLSFFAIRKGDETEITLATTVHFNGVSGRIYFAFVKPFHRLLMKAVLKRMIKYLEKA